MKTLLIPLFLAGCASIQNAPHVGDMSEEDFSIYVQEVRFDARDVKVLVNQAIEQGDLPEDSLTITAQALQGVVSGELQLDQVLTQVEGYEGAVLYIFLSRISRQLPQVMGERTKIVLGAIADEWSGAGNAGAGE